MRQDDKKNTAFICKAQEQVLLCYLYKLETTFLIPTMKCQKVCLYKYLAPQHINKVSPQ